MAPYIVLFYRQIKKLGYFNFFSTFLENQTKYCIIRFAEFFFVKKIRGVNANTPNMDSKHRALMNLIVSFSILFEEILLTENWSQFSVILYHRTFL